MAVTVPFLILLSQQFILFINEYAKLILQAILGAQLPPNCLSDSHRGCSGLLCDLPRRVRQNEHPVPVHRCRLKRKKRYPLPNTGQQQGYNPFKIIRQVHSTGAGLSALYTGFDAHLYGRLTYLAVRNTIYSTIYNIVKPVKPYNDLSYREKSLIGAFAGAIGAVISHPFTVVSIRQILDTQTKPEWRRNYSESPLQALNELKATG